MMLRGKYLEGRLISLGVLSPQKRYLRRVIRITRIETKYTNQYDKYECASLLRPIYIFMCIGLWHFAIFFQPVCRQKVRDIRITMCRRFR